MVYLACMISFDYNYTLNGSEVSGVTISHLTLILAEIKKNNYQSYTTSTSNSIPLVLL